MQTILFNILLILIIVWVFIGILFLWQQSRIACRRLEKACENKNEQKQKQNVSSVTQDQLEQARQVLVGKSKSYREGYDEISKDITTNSQKIPDVPDTSSKEKPADNPNTFVEKNSSVSEEIKEAEGTEEDNEMQVDYTILYPKSHHPPFLQGTCPVSTAGTEMTMHLMRKTKRRCRTRCKRYGAHS